MYDLYALVIAGSDESDMIPNFTRDFEEAVKNKLEREMKVSAIRQEREKQKLPHVGFIYLNNFFI